MKKNESLRKLDATHENLQTIEIQLNEIKPRLRSLTRQVKRLERRAELEEKLRDLQYHYYGETLNKLKRQSVKRKAEEDQLNNQIKKLELEVKSLQQVMFSLTKESSHSDKFNQAQVKYESFFDE